MFTWWGELKAVRELSVLDRQPEVALEGLADAREEFRQNFPTLCSNSAADFDPTRLAADSSADESRALRTPNRAPSLKTPIESTYARYLDWALGVDWRNPSDYKPWTLHTQTHLE